MLDLERVMVSGFSTGAEMVSWFFQLQASIKTTAHPTYTALFCNRRQKKRRTFIVHVFEGARHGALKRVKLILRPQNKLC